jgi:hypothetical protein
MNGSKTRTLVAAALWLTAAAAFALGPPLRLVTWRSYEALGIVLALAQVLVAIALSRWSRRELVLVGRGSRLMPPDCSARTVEIVPTTSSHR